MMAKPIRMAVVMPFPSGASLRFPTMRQQMLPVLLFVCDGVAFALNRRLDTRRRSAAAEVPPATPWWSTNHRQKWTSF
jgi:hypothetical protein